MTTKLFVRCVGLIVLLSSVTSAQDAGSAGPGRKRVITYNGILKYDTGMPRIGIVGLTLSLYAEQEGGDPLWRESQTVQTDEQGRYAVLLGATEEEGLPLEFFRSGKAQWLGLQVQSEEEQPRVLLVTVPYALKAADADTVGGKPLSSFVLYEDLEIAAGKSPAAATIVVQNGVPLARSGISGTENTAGSRSGQGAEKLQLSGGITPVAYNETGSNTWFGEGAGAYSMISPGIDNSFFGQNAGMKTGGGPYYGSYNAFFGKDAGLSNTIGFSNAFFGTWAGRFNNAGSGNSFFGDRAGYSNDADGSTFVGASAGYSNTWGVYNSMFGASAGSANTSGHYNSFFGCAAGTSNTTGSDNAFFGFDSGYDNQGSENAFFGSEAGHSNTSASRNASFGMSSGFYTTTGDVNSFFGHTAGYWNTTGHENSFFGTEAGYTNSTGNSNASFGYRSGYSNNVESNNSYFGAFSDGFEGITNATALGYRATVTQSNSLVLGSISGVNGSFADTKVGIGTTSPDRKLQIASTPGMNAELHIGGAGDEAKDVFSGMGVDPSAGPAFNFGYAGYSFGRSAGFLNVRPDPSAVAPNPSLRFMTANQQRMIITNAGRVGIGTTSPQTTLHVQGESVYVGAPGEGIILKSPDGLMCVKLTVGNTGALVSTPLACP